MTKKSFLIILTLSFSLIGCKSFLQVYTADTDQGNVLTQATLDKLKLGMTPSQVRYLLGTPLLTDTLNPRRWDYVYRYTPGTYSREGGYKSIDNQRISVFFENGVLSNVEGIDTLSKQQPHISESKDLGLKSEPL